MSRLHIRGLMGLVVACVLGATRYYAMHAPSAPAAPAAVPVRPGWPIVDAA